LCGGGIVQVQVPDGVDHDADEIQQRQFFIFEKSLVFAESVFAAHDGLRRLVMSRTVVSRSGRRTLATFRASFSPIKKSFSVTIRASCPITQDGNTSL